MVKAIYTKLKKKHESLPSFEILDHEFEISTLDEEFLLRGIKKKIEEKLTSMSQILSDILQPTPDSFESMYECKYFTPEDKEKIVVIVKELQFFIRAVAESTLLLDDDHDVTLIADITKEIPDLRKKVLPFAKKQKEVWKKESDVAEELEYFG